MHAALAEVPLARPFATAKDQLARQVARHVALRLVLDTGQTAQAEAVPVQYVTGETPESVLRAAAAAVPVVRGLSLRHPGEWSEALAHVEGASLRAGLEMALYTAMAAHSGQSVWRYFGAKVACLETDITISLGADVAEQARQAAEDGFRYLKVKIGSGNPSEDIRRLREIHASAPRARLRLDANQAFTADSALALLREVASLNLPVQLVEQPVDARDLAALDSVAARSPYPVIADEAVLDVATANAVLSQTRAHGLNIKIMKSGVTGSLEIARMAARAGRRLMIGCMLETARGIAFAAALAGGTGLFEFVDLDSHMLLAGQNQAEDMQQSGPNLCCVDVPPRLLPNSH